MVHTVTRVTKGGVINVDTTPHGQHGNGARYIFAGEGEGENSYQFDTETARQIMADDGIAHHFEVDPPLPPLETEAADNEEQPSAETAAQPGTVDAADEQQFLMHKEVVDQELDGSNETHTGDPGTMVADTQRRRSRKP